METKNVLQEIDKEVKRLELSKNEVNQLVRARYGKRWFIQLDETEELDFLSHLRKEHYDF